MLRQSGEWTVCVRGSSAERLLLCPHKAIFCVCPHKSERQRSFDFAQLISDLFRSNVMNKKGTLDAMGQMAVLSGFVNADDIYKLQRELHECGLCYPCHWTATCSSSAVGAHSNLFFIKVMRWSHSSLAGLVNRWRVNTPICPAVRAPELLRAAVLLGITSCGYAGHGKRP